MRRLFPVGLMALIGAQATSAGPPSLAVDCPVQGYLHEGHGNLGDLQVPSPCVMGTVRSLPFTPRLPFCHLQPAVPMAEQSLPDAEPDCGLATMSRKDRLAWAEKYGACRASATPHRNADSAKSDLDAVSSKWDEKFEKLETRLKEAEKCASRQIDVLEEIEKVLRGRPQVDPEQKPKEGGSGASLRKPAGGIEQAHHSATTESEFDEMETDQSCPPEYVHFRHAARIVVDRPEVKGFEALIYEGMYLELFEDGTFRIHYVIETPNTDVVMRLQFVVLDAKDNGEFSIEPIPRTITLPPVRFSRQRDRKAFEDRVFWTVGQAGFSPYLALATRPSGCKTRVLIRKAEAEFGSVPDRPEY